RSARWGDGVVMDRPGCGDVRARARDAGDRLFGRRAIPPPNLLCSWGGCGGGTVRYAGDEAATKKAPTIRATQANYGVAAEGAQSGKRAKCPRLSPTRSGLRSTAPGRETSDYDYVKTSNNCLYVPTRCRAGANQQSDSIAPIR